MTVRFSLAVLLIVCVANASAGGNGSQQKQSGKQFQNALTSTDNQTISPVNTAVLYGDTLRLSCRLNDDPTTISWVFWKEESNKDVHQVDIVRDCVLQPSILDFASVDSDKNGSCNLVVSNIRSSANGKYACFNRDLPDTQYAEVLVNTIEFEPMCSSDIIIGAVNANQNVSLVCVVIVHGPIRPNITWMLPWATISNDTTTDSNDTFTSKIQLTAYPPIFPEVAVKIYFSPPGPQPGPSYNLATNSPTWNYTWTSPSAEISYPSVQNTTYLENKIFVGETVSCFDDHNPRGAYVWQNISNNSTIAEGPVARFTQPGEYELRCTVSVFRKITVERKELLNVAVKNGTQNTTFYCAIEDSIALWKFKKVNSIKPADRIIADKCKVDAKYEAKYSVDTTHGGCSLILREVTIEDAGKYICATSNISETVAMATQLVVIVGDPKCKANNETVKKCDGTATVVRSCQVTFWGNVRPIMKWNELVTGSMVKSNNVHNCDESSCVLNSTINYTASSNNLQLSCITSFPAKQRLLKLVLDLNYTIIDSLNIMDYTYNWTSPIINVSPVMLGCYKDRVPRDIGNESDNYNRFKANLTPKICTTYCCQQGFSYAGVQYGGECFCGNSYGRYGTANNCNVPCTGDSGQICGGGSANNVYKIL